VAQPLFSAASNGISYREASLKRFANYSLVNNIVVRRLGLLFGINIGGLLAAKIVEKGAIDEKFAVLFYLNLFR